MANRFRLEQIQEFYITPSITQDGMIPQWNNTAKRFDWTTFAEIVAPGANENVMLSNGTVWTSGPIPDRHVPITLATDHGLSLSTQTLALGTPSTITSSSTNSVTTSTHTHAITGYVIKSGDTGLGNMTFNNNAVIDVESLVEATVLNIGTANADIINIGYSGSIVNINGILSRQDVDNLTVKDKLITLNKGGGIASGVSTGFEVEENSVIKGWFTTSGARTGFELRAPATSYSAIFLLTSLGAERTYTYPDANGTIALTSDIPVVTGFATKALDNLVSVAMNASLQWDNTVARTFDIAPTANTVVGRALTISAGSTVTAGTADMAGGNLTLNSGLGKGIGASSIIFQTGRTLTTGSTLQTLTTAMTILGTGNVGIGTTGPVYPLDVTGNITTNGAVGTSLYGTGQIIASSPGNTIGSGFYAQIGTGTGTYGGYGMGYGTTAKWIFGMSKGITDTTGLVFYEDGLASKPRMMIATGGNVGIGTTSPISLTEIQGGLTTVGAVFTLSSKETSTVINDVLGRINFRAALDASGTDAILTAASIVAIAEGTFSVSNNATSLLFQTGASEVATTKMTLTSTGDLIIPGSLGATGTRLTKIWTTDIESTNTPTVGGVTVSLSTHVHTGTTFSLLNDQWLTALDYAGNLANLVKLSKDNLVEFGADVAIDAFYHVLNSGFNDIVDIPVDASSVSGTKNGIGITIGETRLFEIAAEKDATTGILGGYMVIPKMTTAQRDAITVPIEGMIIFNVTTHVLNFWAPSAWAAV